jgi:hypothetical protein
MDDGTDNRGMTRSQWREATDDVPSNPLDNPTIGEIIARRSRRDVMRGMLGVSAMSAMVSPAALFAGKARAQQNDQAEPSFTFEELDARVAADHRVAQGYDAKVLIRWGDPVVPGAPAFDPMNQSAEAQEQQFGYNNDFIGYLPLPQGSDSSDHGLLTVNHEYTNEELMFPNYTEDTAETVEIEMAAHGLSVIEVRRDAEGGQWSYEPTSEYNRRVSLRSTPVTFSGPAAGHDRLKTSTDADGMRVIGTVNNCAGGTTPWGTSLHAEENFHGYFGGSLPQGHPEARNHERYGVPGEWYSWHKFHSRFDIGQEPNEPNRFGWMVELDPYDPSSTPVKRTALGRFKHEGADIAIGEDGSVSVYMGDDQRFDYLYRFVANGRFNPDDREANRNLLDDGTLFVAKFNEDGKVDWLPLVHGEGPLTEANGFTSQADVLIETRVAADLLGATPMDRPEDVEHNPQTGRVYVMLTNNSRREPGDTNAANPRPSNEHGHILEIATGGDYTKAQDDWSILVLCGNPDNPADQAVWGPATTRSGWFADPDNCAIDNRGRLWVTTDGNSDVDTGRSDGVWAMETEGELRGSGKHFYSCPAGAEMCGPYFTPSDETLFLAVQHPADDGEEWTEFNQPSTFENPSTRWPDFEDGMPPRPSVVAVVKIGGGKIA